MGGGQSLSKLELLCIKSWLDNGFKFRLYTYNLDDTLFNALAKLYKDFELKDANEIIPFEDIFYDDKGAGLAIFSDFFRFTMLQRGTDQLWVDLDIICLKPFIFNKPYIFATEISGEQDKNIQITTGFLKFPKNSQLGSILIERARQLVSKTQINPWGIIGPWFLAKWVEELDLTSWSIDYREINQISFFEVHRFLDKNDDIDWDRKCLHFFNEAWRVHNPTMRKNASYHQNCVYERLQEKHQLKELLQGLNYQISFYDKYIYRYIYGVKAKIREFKLNLKKRRRALKSRLKHIFKPF